MSRLACIAASAAVALALAGCHRDYNDQNNPASNPNATSPASSPPAGQAPANEASTGTRQGNTMPPPATGGTSASPASSSTSQQP
jgi:hypothetical protein